MEQGKPGASRAWLIGGALLFGMVGAGVWSSQQLPEGPEEVIWDRDVCAHCQMHVGEPSFAAQLQTTDRSVIQFDDPGCALAYIKRQNPEIHALYFHHGSEGRWLKAPEVGFVPHTPTPMGYGWKAVLPDVPGAISLGALTQRLPSAPLPAGRP